MKCFVKGIVEREPLRKLLADLYEVYSTLEAALQRHAEHPIVGPINLPLLYRTAALTQDLTFFCGEQWPQAIAPSPAAGEYRDHLQAIATTEPPLLVAHAYTRYLGDLSGGQSLKRIIRSALALPPDQGTALYEFPELPTPESRHHFKDQYRQILDRLPVDAVLADRIVAEANHAFALNRALMQALEADVKAAVGEHVFDLLTRQDRPGSTRRQSPESTPEFVS